MNGRPGDLGAGLVAVATLAAREALRSRLVLIVALALALGLGGLAWTATGDGTAAGRLQAFFSWSIGWTSLVLSLTTVFVSTTIAQGLRDGRLVPLSVGPLSRAGLVVGWWLGQAAVVTGLVALASLLLLGLAQGIAWRTPAADRARLEPLLGAREVARPPAPDDSDLPGRADEVLRELDRKGRLEHLGPDERDAVLARIEGELRHRRRSVSTGQVKTWRIEGVTPDPGTRTIALRFRYTARVADGSGLPEGQGPRGTFSIYPPEGQGGSLPGRWPGGTSHEVLVPADVLEGSSVAFVEYQLQDPRPIVLTFPEGGPELLFPSGGLAGNVARAGLVLLGRLLFLLAVGVATSALIDGKLAALLVLFVLAVGSGSGFLAESLEGGHPFTALGPLVASLLGNVLDLTLRVLPDLAREDVGDRLSQGELVTWSQVGASLVLDGLVRGGGLLLLGALLFSRRELGAVR